MVVHLFFVNILVVLVTVCFIQQQVNHDLIESVEMKTLLKKTLLSAVIALVGVQSNAELNMQTGSCLLYTSDAADE